MASTILENHLRNFIISKDIHPRLYQTCHNFWTQHGKLPHLADIVSICKVYLCNNIVSNMFGEYLYNRFLEEFITLNGVFPSFNDTLDSFTFYKLEKRFPNLVELTNMDFILQDANDVNGSTNNKKSSKIENKEIIKKLKAIKIEEKDYKKYNKEQCSICLNTFQVGDQICRLTCCSNILHYGDSKSCGGIVECLKHKNACPLCQRIVI